MRKSLKRVFVPVVIAAFVVGGFVPAWPYGAAVTSAEEDDEDLRAKVDSSLWNLLQESNPLVLGLGMSPEFQDRYESVLQHAVQCIQDRQSTLASQGRNEDLDSTVSSCTQTAYDGYWSPPPTESQEPPAGPEEAAPPPSEEPIKPPEGPENPPVTEEPPVSEPVAEQPDDSLASEDDYDRLADPNKTNDPRLNTPEGCLTTALLEGLDTAKAFVACADRMGRLEGGACPAKAPSVLPGDPARVTWVGALLVQDCNAPSDSGQGQSEQPSAQNTGQLTAEQIAEKQRQMQAEFEAAGTGDAIQAQQRAEAAQRAQAAANNQAACDALKARIKAEFQKMFTSQFNEPELLRLNDEALRLNCQIDLGNL